MKKLLILLTLFIIITKSYSQDRVANLNIDSSVFHFGSPIELSIEITKKIKDNIDLSSLYQISENIEILKEKKVDSLKIDNERIKITRKYLFTVYDTGIIKIPPLPIIFKNAEKSDTIYTNPFTVYVKSIPIDSTNTIRDIREIYKMPLTLKEIIIYILVLCLIAGSIFIITYLIKLRKKNNKKLNSFEFSEPAHIIALRELDNLKNYKLWQRNEVKLHYSILSSIIRKYIERRFEINAMEMISEEIIQKISGLINSEDLKILRDLLYDADMVKFANYIPEPTENLKHLDNAYIFVNHTKKTNELTTESVKNKFENEQD